TRCIETGAPRVVELRAKFYLPRHLLEQPSSSVSGYRGGQRRNSVGQPSSPVLAVALSVHNSVDGRKSPRRNPHRYLWLCAVDGGNCLLCFAANDHRQRRPRIAPCAGYWQRLERKTLSPALPQIGRA